MHSGLNVSSDVSFQKKKSAALEIESIIYEGEGVDFGSKWPDLSFLSSGFGFIENGFSMFAGIVDGYSNIKYLDDISSFGSLSDGLMFIGMVLNLGLSAYDNFILPNNLTRSQRCGNLLGDISYIGLSGGVTYGIGYLTFLIPVVGPFIAPVISFTTGVVLDQVWTGKDILWIDGFNVSIEGKALEEWFKNILACWFGG